MHDLARAHDAPAEGLADALVAEADAENRHACRRSAGSPRSEMPASFGVQGPGEITIFAGASASMSSSVISSLRTTFTSAPSSPRYCTTFQVKES